VWLSSSAQATPALAICHSRWSPNFLDITQSTASNFVSHRTKPPASQSFETPSSSGLVYTKCVYHRTECQCRRAEAIERQTGTGPSRQRCLHNRRESAGLSAVTLNPNPRAYGSAIRYLAAPWSDTGASRWPAGGWLAMCPARWRTGDGWGRGR
jgi:hypothetical protein